MSPDMLAVAIGIAVLSLAALSQAYAHRVPNFLTLPAILAGWAFAIYLDAAHHAAFPGNALRASLLGTFVALMIMVPVYGSAGLGAGCVKAQMAFAAWTCGVWPLAPAMAFIACATVAGLAVTFVLLHWVAARIPDE